MLPNSSNLAAQALQPATWRCTRNRAIGPNALSIIPDSRMMARSHSMGVLRPGLRQPKLAQVEPRPRQARHHRADRHSSDFRDFLVGEVLDLAQQQNLAILHWQLFHQPP